MSFIPASLDHASKCKIPFVDPPTAFNIVIAFSNASNVKISLGFIPISNKLTHALPAVSYTHLTLPTKRIV